MVEKKFVIDGMKLSYNGPFSVIEFYKTVEDWISKKGKEKDIKKKSEHVDPKGKKIEWLIEIWEEPAEYIRTIVRLQALFTDITETKVKKGKKTRKLNKGNALIILDGILETDIEGKWQQKPMFYFIRALVDRFLWKFHSNKGEDQLAADVNELHDTLKEFFDSYAI